MVKVVEVAGIIMNSSSGTTKNKAQAASPRPAS
jgi:hypothetical protein